MVQNSHSSKQHLHKILTSLLAPKQHVAGQGSAITAQHAVHVLCSSLGLWYTHCWPSSTLKSCDSAICHACCAQCNVCRRCSSAVFTRMCFQYHYILYIPCTCKECTVCVTRDVLMSTRSLIKPHLHHIQCGGRLTRDTSQAPPLPAQTLLHSTPSCHQPCHTAAATP
jgi:hypothetical protein